PLLFLFIVFTTWLKVFVCVSTKSPFLTSSIFFNPSLVVIKVPFSKQGNPPTITSCSVTSSSFFFVTSPADSNTYKCLYDLFAHLSTSDAITHSPPKLFNATSNPPMPLNNDTYLKSLFIFLSSLYLYSCFIFLF